MQKYCCFDFLIIHGRGEVAFDVCGNDNGKAKHSGHPRNLLVNKKIDGTLMKDVDGVVSKHIFFSERFFFFNDETVVKLMTKGRNATRRHLLNPQNNFELFAQNANIKSNIIVPTTQSHGQVVSMSAKKNGMFAISLLKNPKKTNVMMLKLLKNFDQNIGRVLTNKSKHSEKILNVECLGQSS